MSIGLIFVFVVTTVVNERIDWPYRKEKAMTGLWIAAVLVCVLGWYLVATHNAQNTGHADKVFYLGAGGVTVSMLFMGALAAPWLYQTLHPKVLGWFGESPTPLSTMSPTGLKDAFDDLNELWHPSDYMKMEADGNISVLKVDGRFQMWIRPGGAANPNEWWRIPGPRKVAPGDLSTFGAPKFTHPVEVRFLKYGPDRPNAADSSVKSL